MSQQNSQEQRQNEEIDFKQKYEQLLAQSNAEKQQWQQRENTYQDHISVLQQFIEQSDMSESFQEHVIQRQSLSNDFSRMSSTRSLNVVNPSMSLNFNQSEILAHRTNSMSQYEQSQMLSNQSLKSPLSKKGQSAIMVFKQDSDVEQISEGLNEGLQRSSTQLNVYRQAENFEVIAETNSLDDESSINENSQVVDRGNIQNQSIISLTQLMQQMNPNQKGGIHVKSPSGPSKNLKTKQEKLSINRPQTVQENSMMKLAVKSQIPKTPKKLLPKEKNPAGRNTQQSNSRNVHQTTSKIAGKSALSSYKIQKPYSSRPASGQSFQNVTKQQSEKINLKPDQMNTSRSFYNQFIETTSNIIRKQPSSGIHSKNESATSFNFLGIRKPSLQREMLTPVKDKVVEKKARTDAHKRRIQQNRAAQGMMDFTNAGLTIDESNKSKSGSSSPSERNPLNSFFTQVISPSRGSKIAKRNNKNVLPNMRKQNLSQILKPTTFNLLRPTAVNSPYEDKKPSFPTAKPYTSRPSPNLPFPGAVQIKKFDSDEIPDLGQINSKSLNQFVSQTTVKVSQLDPNTINKMIPIQDFDLFENTNNQIFPVQLTSSSIVLEDGDENVRDSVIKSPNLENFSSFVKNNQQRFSTDATFGRRKANKKERVELGMDDDGTIEENKLEENCSESEDDEFDREEGETKKLHQDLDNLMIEDEGNQNDSDVESSKSIDRQFYAAKEKDTNKSDSFSRRNLQYFSRSEVQQPKGTDLETSNKQNGKKIIINLPSLRKKLAASHVSENSGNKNEGQRGDEEEGFIEKVQQRKRGFTVLDTRQDIKDTSSNGDANPKNFMSRSYKGKSVQGGTLNLGKTTNAFLQEEDPGYLGELMGSIVGQLQIKKTFNRVSQNATDSMYQKINSNFKSQKNMKFGIHSSLPRMDVKKKRLRDDSNEEGKMSEVGAENTQSQGHDLGPDELSQFRSSGISIETNLHQRKGILQRGLSLTSIKSITEDEESQIPINLINMDNSQIIPFGQINKSIAGEQIQVNCETEMEHVPRMSTLEKGAFQDQLQNKNKNSRNIRVIPKAATRGTDFQSSMMNRENIEWEEDALRRTGKPGELNYTQPIQSISTQKIFSQKNKSIVDIIGDSDEIPRFDARQVNSYVLQNQNIGIMNPQTQGIDALLTPDTFKDDLQSSEDLGEARQNNDPTFRDQSLHNTILTTSNHPSKSKLGTNYSFNKSLLQPDSSFIDPSAINLGTRFSELNQWNAQIHYEVQEKIMEFARFRKQKPQRLFEQFYVVGVKPQGLEKMVSGFEDQDGENNDKTDQQFLRGQMMYKYPQKAEMKQIEVRSKVIHDWVFPDGVYYEKIGNMQSPDTKDLLNALLYEIPNNRRNTFMFTLDANIDDVADSSQEPLSPLEQDEIDPQENGTGNYFNCLCVKYYVLVERQSDGQIFRVEQAFCMISRNNFFQAQYDAIDKLLQVINMNQKMNQIHNSSSKQIEDDGSFNPHDSVAMMAQNFFIVDYSHAGTYVSIHDLYEIQLRYKQPLSKHELYVSLFPISMEIKTDIYIKASHMNDQDTLKIPFEYKFPSTVKECYSMDFTWHVPIVLQVFQDLRIIMRLLTAILLEKSIVFVSSDAAKLTSVILGFKSLMKPFDWSYTLAPNLPAAMQGILESPIPMLVGISRELLHSIREEDSLDQDSIDSKTWVFLDKDEGPLSNDLSYQNLQSPLWQQDAGIAWCLTDEQVSMEGYLWFNEYPELDNLIQIHQDFRNCRTNTNDQTGQMDDEDSLFEVSDKQMAHLQKFYDKFNEMIISQIVCHVNLKELNEQNRLFDLQNQEVDTKSLESANKISDVQKLEIFKQMVLDQCTNLDLEVKDEFMVNIGLPTRNLSKLQLNPKSSSRNRIQSSNTQGPSLAVMKRISVLQQTRQLTKHLDVESVDRQIEELGGSALDVRPFLEELVQTTAFQQMLQDLIKRRR